MERPLKIIRISSCYCIGLQIVGSELRTAVALNYEQQRTYSITVRSYDNGSPALYVDQVFTIRVIDVNERPSALNTTTMYINENSPLNAFIGVMVGIDPDNFRQSGRQTLTYDLIDSANGLFKLDQDILRVSSFTTVSFHKLFRCSVTSWNTRSNCGNQVVLKSTGSHPEFALQLHRRRSKVQSN